MKNRTPVIIEDIHMPFLSIGGVHGEMGHRLYSRHHHRSRS